MNTSGTGTLRLSRETLSKLNSIRMAARTVLEKDLGQDETIEMLIGAVFYSNPALWTAYREIEMRKQQMESDSLAKSIQAQYGLSKGDTIL